MTWAAVGVSVASLAAGAASGALSAGKKPKVPTVPLLNPEAAQRGAIAGNIQQLPQIANLTAGVNQITLSELQKALEFALPGGTGKARDTILSQLGGELAPEDTRSVIRNATAAGFGSGIRGSPIGRNLVLRDLGRSVVEQKERGLNNFFKLADFTRSVSFNPASMFLTPAQRLEADAINNRTQYDAALAQAGIDAQPGAGQKALSGALGSLSSIGGTFAGSSFASTPSQVGGGWTTPTTPRSQSGSLNTPGRFNFPSYGVS